MKTFIRAAEIWLPDADGYLLEFGSGYYGAATEFGALSRSMCFGRGEGLPGRVWEDGLPVVLQDLQGGFFQRAAAAKRAGLTCAVAFPLFVGAALKAVVVLFCSDAAVQSGAIEVWRGEAGAAALTLLDGVYGAQDAAFAAASRGLSLPSGAGLPGSAWKLRRSVFLDGLAGAAGFARSGSAAASGLVRGLAIPCPLANEAGCVLTFLSSPEVPIATRIESWVPATEARTLQRAHGFQQGVSVLAVEERALAAADPAVVASFADGVPRAAQDGLLVWPGVVDGQVVEVIALHF